MRHIDRGEPIVEYSHFVTKESPKDWVSDFVHVRHDLYEKVREKLKEEQGNISGYTEVPLKGNIHIDHFKKRSLYPQPDKVFDWYNLVVDEKNRPYGADKKDDTVRSPEENEKLVNPVKENPRDFFTYQANGNIIPLPSLTGSDRERADFTIKTFNLNHESLRRKRMNMMCQVENALTGGLTLEITKAVFKDYGFPSVLDYMEEEGLV